jgi:hypothetical protein
MFFPPNGRKEVGAITKILPEDQAYFEKHDIKLSMEELGNNAVVYADTGHIVDGEPDELIEVSRGRTCEETLSALRKRCEARLGAAQ